MSEVSASMSSTEMPCALIAAAIRRERGRAGLSLSALAMQAGLAKSTLSQLESGRGNPNIETLWAIARALGIPFSALFETGEQNCELVRAGEGVPMPSSVADMTAVLLARCPPNRRRDVYRLDLAEGAARQAEPHPPGVVEHLIVVSGSLRAGPVGPESRELAQGDYFRFPADVAHSYVALNGPVTVITIMDMPS